VSNTPTQNSGTKTVPHLSYDPKDLPLYIERLFKDLRIAVLYGGDKKGEDSVLYPTVNFRPWKSYQIVAEHISEALQTIGFQNVTVMPDDMRLFDRLQKENIQFCYLNTGGVQGRDAMTHTPAMLEMLGMPYVGHRPMHSGILDNKYIFKQLVESLGIRTPSYVYWDPRKKKSCDPTEDDDFRTTFGDNGNQFVVKPVSGRASLFVQYVEDEGGLAEAVDIAHSGTHAPVIIEKYLPGREFCVAVCGSVVKRHGEFGDLGDPFAFSTLERVLEKDERVFTSMDKKAITRSRIRLLADGDQIKQELIDLSQHLFSALALQTLVRFDLRADSEGIPYVLEVNPKPDMFRPSKEVVSLVSMGLNDNGMTYEDLVLSLMGNRLHEMFLFPESMPQYMIDMLSS
jgi:D-alanine-D-alanine ligase